MPRNACRECRSRKIKCVSENPGRKCERCTARNLHCSYVPEKPAEPQHEPQHPGPCLPRPIQPSVPPVSMREPVGSPQPRYRLTHELPGLDIGAGRPSEILREGEFTQSLLLLYFSNFADVHFLFDEELFLRHYAVGEIPKIVLYATMALSIRYSHAPFDDAVSPSHRGEILYDHTRELAKENFDEPSITMAQVYVLLSTYKLTFGGARAANVYLGYAVNMIKALRLLDDAEVDPLQLELSRRLVGTIALMDRILSPALRFPLHMISTQYTIPRICSDEDFGALKRRTSLSSRSYQPSVAQEIVDLSKILAAVCQGYRSQDPFAVLSEQEDEHRRSVVGFEPALAWTNENLEQHQRADSLRRFAFMHVLYHHVGQLIYFKSLSRMQDNRLNRNDLETQVTKCHYHSRTIANIAEYTWTYAGFDLHNFVMGQCLTVATVVHTHALLLAAGAAEATEVQNRIEALRTCVGRVKRHCRMFNWVSTSLDQFLHLCNQSNRPLNEVFDRDPSLLGQMLQLGSHFERLDYRTGGRVQGLEPLLKSAPSSDPSPAGSHETWSPVSNHNPSATVNHNHHVHRGNLPMDLASQSQKWTLDGLAWAFSDSSLPQLYALPNS